MTDSSARASRAPGLAFSVPALIFLVGTIALALFAGQHYFISMAHMESNEIRVAELLGLATSAGLEAALRRDDTSEARRTVERANIARGLSFAFYVDPDDRIPFATPSHLAGESLEQVSLSRLSAEVRQVRGQVRGRVWITGDGERVAGVYPVFLDAVRGRRVGAFVHEHDIRLQRSLVVRETARWSALGGCCLLALCSSLWIFLRRVLLVRLSRVRDFASAIGREDAPTAIAVSGHDEIATLARHMESTAQTLAERSRLLHQAQKMEAVGRLAGGVAHDFNNLLTVILGNCEVMQANLAHEAHGSEASGMLDEIERAGTRAAALTQQLLAFSRQDVLQPQVLSPAAVLRDMSALLDRVIGPNHRVVLRATSRLSVRIDVSHLEQIVLNLVVNARDAMAAGGAIAVECHDRAKTTAADGAAPEAVEILVRDTGTGMSRDVIDRVFEPFFTTKPLGQGTGLGMSTVFSAVKQAGGTVEVESAVGRGTCVRVLLLGLTESAPGVARERALTTNGGTILLCDDDDDVRTVTARILEESGYQVCQSASGSTALRYLVDHANEVDVLLTDVLMPDIDGLDLARRAMSIRPDLPIVFVSGFASRLSADDLAEFPRAAFVAKPFSSRDLIEALEKGSERGADRADASDVQERAPRKPTAKALGKIAASRRSAPRD